MTLQDIKDATNGSPLQSIARLKVLFRTARNGGDELAAETAMLVALAIIDENKLMIRGLVGGFTWLVEHGSTPETRRRIRAYAKRLASDRLLLRLRSTKAVRVTLEPDVAAALAEAEAEAASREAGK